MELGLILNLAFFSFSTVLLTALSISEARKEKREETPDVKGMKEAA